MFWEDLAGLAQGIEQEEIFIGSDQQSTIILYIYHDSNKT